MERTLDVPGVPRHELLRSPAARRVGRLAAASGLFGAHHEHRVELEPPADWLPEGRQDLRQLVTWNGGILPERKYQIFRHDFIPARFNPGHRAKWTAHELCHGLVGFAWRPGASSFFHALAARIAEILPVALWYWLDEAGLRRCPEHAGGGPLFNSFCRACELAAREPGRDDDPQRERWYREGRTFVDRELAAVARSRRLGRPVGHRHATLELSTDGLNYAASQDRRLRSPEFHQLMERFFPPGTGRVGSLDELESRVVEVLSGIVEGAEVRPLAGGPWRFAVQDVAWRLLTVRAQSEGTVVSAIDALVDHLAGAPDKAGIAAVIEGYRELFNEYHVPEPEDLFAVGYPLPGGYGRSLGQIASGIASSCPAAWQLLGDRATEVASRFVQHDAPMREPIGRRFARFLKGDERTALVSLAEYEAAITHADGPRPEAALGMSGARGERLRLADGIELIEADFDVAELASSVRAGQPSVPETRPTYLVVTRTLAGEVFVADLSPDAARAVQALREGPKRRSELRLGDTEVDTLAQFGLVLPVAWDSD